MVIKRIIRSLLSSVLILSAVSTAALAQIRRVPAEFEPQEAIWLQWPGHYEKAYEPAYAQIAIVIVERHARSQDWGPGLGPGRLERLKRQVEGLAVCSLEATVGVGQRLPVYRILGPWLA